jgi:hypothetical protein
LDPPDFIIFYLRKGDLFRETQRIVATLIESFARDALEIFETRKDNVGELLKKVVGAITTKSYLESNNFTFTKVKGGNESWTWWREVTGQ